MNSKTSKLGAIVLTVILFGTAFFVPASSVNVEQTQINYGNTTQPLDYYQEIVDDPGPYKLDNNYEVNPATPLNRDDNDDAGYKRDCGDEQSRAYAIFPNEHEDDWPGRGRTGKLDSYDKEDWYFFCVCVGQEIQITMTPPTNYNFDIGLWDIDEVELETSTNSGSTMESITYTALYTGRYYLRIHFIDGPDEGQYTFDVDIVGQNDAGTSADAGNDFASATTIAEGTYDGFLDMDDEEDWYKFTAAEGQGIHFILGVNPESYLSDADLYLYDPSGNEAYRQNYYYDDELLYPAYESGQWRIQVKLFPGYTDVPDPSSWEYWTYGSGPYSLDFTLEESAPEPPTIPQPDITPIAQTFIVPNAPGSNEDEYGYLASIPACNYLDGGERYLSPIVYTGDSTLTEWFGTVDDTTNYLLDDWNTYLSGQGKTVVEYYVNSDPVKAAAEIATEAWSSSNLAVVAVEGSGYEDTITEVIYQTATLPRNKDVTTVPSSSPDFKEGVYGGYNYEMWTEGKWGAINVQILDDDEKPSIVGLFPHYMTLTSDWWPEHDPHHSDIYYPVTSPGLYTGWVGSVAQNWDMIITQLECDRYKIIVDNSDSVLTATVTTSTPSDLLVFLVDPQGFLRAPDVSEWNGGPINPIHEWNGIDSTTYPPSCEDWADWEVEDHTEFTAEVLHPEVGEWTAIVVPRYNTDTGNIQYTISGKIREINQKRANAALSAANAAVIASQENVPLLYVTEDSVPSETQAAFDALGVTNVIFVQKGSIGSGVEGSLPTIDTNLKTMQQIIDYIKAYSHSENYVTITSLKSGDGYFAPSAMIAASHCSPVLRIADAKGSAGGGTPLFIGQIDGNTYCLDSESGQFACSDPEGWTPVDPNQNPPENSIYLGSSEDTIYCIDVEDMGMIWYSRQDYQNVDTEDGSLYLSLSDNNIRCIDNNNGDELWSFPLNNRAEGRSPASMANLIDTWRLWGGDYYHGNRAPGHLPIWNEPVQQMTPWELLLIFLGISDEELPPTGMDRKRYWNERMHDDFRKFVDDFGLDGPGQEVYQFVAPRKDIRLELHASLIGLNSYAGHIPGTTPAYANAIVIRNVLYPAVIYANPNRHVMTTQFMNFPDGGTWKTNDGVNHQVYSSRVIKNAFMSHGRTYDGRILWESHLERMNDGVAAFYYSGHGTGGSGMSAQYFQTDYCNYPEQEWFDAWRGYMFDNWKTPRDNGRRWYNPEPANLYDFIHYKWHDHLFDNLMSAAVFYMSCSTGQQFGPLIYLDHGAVMWYGNAGSGLCPQADLLDDWMFEDCMVNGLPMGEAYSKYVWLHHRDFTIGEGNPHFEESMYGPSSIYGDDGITTVPVIYGDPTIIIYSPEWTEPTAIDSVMSPNNAPPLAPEITGPNSGKPGESYTFNFVTTDPNGDDISYYVDWGDGDFEDWDGPYSSGTGSSASHTWDSQGMFNVKVKAKDSSGAEGPWGVLNVNIPRAKSFNMIAKIIQMIFERFPLLEQIVTKLLSL